MKKQEKLTMMKYLSKWTIFTDNLQRVMRNKFSL